MFTSFVVENVATLTIKAVLRESHKADVRCKVQCNAKDLLQGNLEAAEVQGANWMSPLGLTCRTIDVKVGKVSLDMDFLFRQQALKFPLPPTGEAKIEFNEKDFENLLLHPLLTAAPVKGHKLEKFEFMRGDCKINPSTKTICFAGRWKGRRRRIALSERGDGKLVGTMLPTFVEDEDKIGESMSQYFDNLELDLDGVSFKFKNMGFGVRDSMSLVTLSLDIVVTKVPSVRKAMF